MPQPYIRKKYTTDYIALPEYLSEQARKGLFIKKIKPLWLCFEKGEPAELDYKVIPINTSDELDELNRQTGWKRVLIYNSMAIICAPAGTSFPLVDDEETMLVKLKFMRTMHIFHLLLALSGLIFAVYSVFQWWGNITYSGFALLLSIVLLGFAIYEPFCMSRVQKAINKLKNKQ